MLLFYICFLYSSLSTCETEDNIFKYTVVSITFDGTLISAIDDKGNNLEYLTEKKFINVNERLPNDEYIIFRVQEPVGYHEMEDRPLNIFTAYHISNTQENNRTIIFVVEYADDSSYDKRTNIYNNCILSNMKLLRYVKESKCSLYNPLLWGFNYMIYSNCNKDALLALEKQRMELGKSSVTKKDKRYDNWANRIDRSKIKNIRECFQKPNDKSRNSALSRKNQIYKYLYKRVAAYVVIKNYGTSALEGYIRSFIYRDHFGYHKYAKEISLFLFSIPDEVYRNICRRILKKPETMVYQVYFRLLYEANLLSKGHYLEFLDTNEPDKITVTHPVIQDIISGKVIKEMLCLYCISDKTSLLTLFCMILNDALTFTEIEEESKEVSGNNELRKSYEDIENFVYMTKEEEIIYSMYYNEEYKILLTNSDLQAMAGDWHKYIEQLKDIRIEDEDKMVNLVCLAKKHYKKVQSEMEELKKEYSHISDEMLSVFHE